MMGDGRSNSFDDPAVKSSKASADSYLSFHATSSQRCASGVVAVVPDEVDLPRHPVHGRGGLVPQAVLQHDRDVLLTFLNAKRQFLLWGIGVRIGRTEAISNPASPDALSHLLAEARRVSRTFPLRRPRRRSGMPDRRLLSCSAGWRLDYAEGVSARLSLPSQDALALCRGLRVLRNRWPKASDHKFDGAAGSDNSISSQMPH